MTLEERIAALAARHRTELSEDLRRGIADLVWEVAAETRCDAEEAATVQEREACAAVAEAEADPQNIAWADDPFERNWRKARAEGADIVAQCIRARGKP